MRLYTALRPFRIVSFGGVGSKMILGGLAPGLSREALLARHRHDRRPPADATDFDWVYVFGDPRDAVLSFFQRQERLHAGHGFAAGERPGQPDWPLRHCRNIGGDAAALARVNSLDTFLGQGVDHFRLEDHIEGWLSARLPRLLFVRYETVWDHAGDLVARLGLPAALVEGFPVRQPRSADHRGLPDDQAGLLERMYGPLARRLEALPDLFAA